MSPFGYLQPHPRKTAGTSGKVENTIPQSHHVIVFSIQPSELPFSDCNHPSFLVISL
jgi:hypothetical protein